MKKDDVFIFVTFPGVEGPQYINLEHISGWVAWHKTDKGPTTAIYVKWHALPFQVLGTPESVLEVIQNRVMEVCSKRFL
jgi:hypothetical protein